jgi:hypothetical protein
MVPQTPPEEGLTAAENLSWYSLCYQPLFQRSAALLQVDEVRSRGTTRAGGVPPREERQSAPWDVPPPRAKASQQK